MNLARFMKHWDQLSSWQTLLADHPAHLDPASLAFFSMYHGSSQAWPVNANDVSAFV